MRRFLCGCGEKEHEQGNDDERGDRADGRALCGKLLVGFVFRGGDNGLCDHRHRGLDQEYIPRHACYAEEITENKAKAGAHDKSKDQ